MGNYKGIGVCFVRDSVSAGGAAATEQMLAGLSEQDAKVYKHTLATTWVDIHAATRIMQRAVTVLYPDDPMGIQTIGYHMAQAHLTGVYRILLRVITVHFALSQTANYWDAYHRTGRVRIIKGTEANAAQLVIEDYPDLPEAFREMLNGYIRGIMDLAGARDGVVKRGKAPDGSWIWDMNWT